MSEIIIDNNSWNKFIEDGSINELILFAIYTKIKHNQRLTAKEESVRRVHSDYIENLLKCKK